jgi:hypothetical protein
MDFIDNFSILKLSILKNIIIKTLQKFKRKIEMRMYLFHTFKVPWKI